MARTASDSIEPHLTLRGNVFNDFLKALVIEQVVLKAVYSIYNNDNPAPIHCFSLKTSVILVLGRAVYNPGGKSRE